MIERLGELSQVFSISICAYAIRSNHYYLVLHLDHGRAAAMSDTEVVEGWLRLFSLPLLLQNFLKGDAQDSATRRVVDSLILELRSRLRDLSWYMRYRANAEGECTGRFWEGRFKSLAILDEAGLLACCAYVDLNPIRAGMADVPEKADYTSIQQRIRVAQAANAVSETRTTSNTKLSEKKPLPHIFEDANVADAALPLHFFGNSLSIAPALDLPCSLPQYVELVDWAARIVHSDKKHAMSNNTPPILTQLGITPEQFQQSMQSKVMSRGSAIGQIERLKAYAAYLQKRCVIGVGLKVPILNSV